MINIKQFVVTTVGKERRGSVVTETVRIRVLIIVDTSKELNFDIYSKYRFREICAFHQSFEPEKIRLIFEKGGSAHIK